MSHDMVYWRVEGRPQGTMGVGVEFHPAGGKRLLDPTELWSWSLSCCSIQLLLKGQLEIRRRSSGISLSKGQQLAPEARKQRDLVSQVLGGTPKAANLGRWSWTTGNAMDFHHRKEG